MDRADHKAWALVKLFRAQDTRISLEDSARQEASLVAPRSAESDLESLRVRLARNKIFFDTLGILGLGVVGLLIAYQGNQLAQAQTRLIELQTLAAQTPLRPQVRVETYHVPDDEGNAAEIVQFVNDGGPLKGPPTPSIVQISFLEVVRISAGGGKEPSIEIKHLPWYCFGPVNATRNSTGVLIVFEGVDYEGNTPAFGRSEYQATSGRQRRQGSGEFGDFRISQRQSLERLRTTLSSLSTPQAAYEVEVCVFFELHHGDLFGEEHQRLVLWAPPRRWEYPLLNVDQFVESNHENIDALRHLLFSSGPPSTTLPSAKYLVDHFSELPALSDVMIADSSAAVRCGDVSRLRARSVEELRRRY